MVLTSAPLRALTLIVLLTGPLQTIQADTTRIFETGAPVATFPSAELEQSGLVNTNELLDKLPHAGATTVVDGAQIRGINIPATGSMGPGRQRPLILINGRQLSGSDTFNTTGVPGHIDLNTLSTNAIERIEVLKEGGSALYGSNALAGVINFVIKDEYEAIEFGQSPVFNNIYGDLNRYYFSTENSERCDATDGEIRPLWSAFPNHDWGGPNILDGGNVWEFGSKSDGFDSRLADFGGPFPGAVVPRIDLDLTSPEAVRAAGYIKLGDLIERIRNDPAISDDSKGIFGMMLGFWWHLGDASEFSDSAFFFGTVDPDQIIEMMRQYSAAGLTPAPVATSDMQFPPAPDAKDLPEPFTGFSYPPEYLLDDPNDCPEHVKKEIRELIAVRDQARADRSYYSDYLNVYANVAERKADEDKAKAADKLARETNDKIKRLLVDCVPQAAATVDPPPADSTPPGGAADSQPLHRPAQRSTRSRAGFHPRLDGIKTAIGSWNSTIPATNEKRMARFVRYPSRTSG